MGRARPARPDDLGRLAELAAEAVGEQQVGRGGAVWAAREGPQLPAGPALRAALDDDGALVLAGTYDDVVVGYAVAHTEPLRDGTTLAVVDAVYVEPPAREVGVGEALLEAVLTWADARGCRGVDALVLPGNRSAKNFFERFGLVARAILVHRPLHRGGEGA